SSMIDVVSGRRTTPMLRTCAGRRNSSRGSDRALEQRAEVIHPHPLAFGLVPPPVEEAGIELLADERVLDRPREPIHQGDDRLEVDVGAHLAAPLPPFAEPERAVRILA